MSWKSEVQAGNTGKWIGNALRFATKKEADDYVYDLAMRWSLVTNVLVTQSEDPVNYSYHGGVLNHAEVGLV